MLFGTLILDCVNFSHSPLVFGVLAYTLQNFLNCLITISDSIKFLDCFSIGIVVRHYLRRNRCNCLGGTFFNAIEEGEGHHLQLTLQETVVRTHM